MSNKGKGLHMSKVEKSALDRIGQKLIYPPTEKMGVIVVDDFSALGKLTALRFLEWILANPGGVISLPTGKTPTYFIKWVTHYLATWDELETQRDLETNGLGPGRRPKVEDLHFVQIDEFYPISPTQQNSLSCHVNRNYISGFGLDPRKTLLIDCSEIGLPSNLNLKEAWPEAEVDLTLRHRHPRNNQERLQKGILQAVDQWCHEYEEKIRGLGGIGFFLGGIGPDGHIAFNVTGSDHNSTTRLTRTNYETQAAASADLGGIEVSRKRLVITIGLSTIIHAQQCTAVIIAAGEAKARVVRDAVQEGEHVRYPATALHKLPNARFYVTRGAARLLDERQHVRLMGLETVPDEIVERTVIDLALKLGKRICELDEKEFKGDRFASALLNKVGGNIPQVTGRVEQTLLEKIEAGRLQHGNTSFLHIVSHYEDLVLGYLPYAIRHMRDTSNTHTFLYLTPNFAAVTNGYLLSLLQKLDDFMKRCAFDDLLKSGYFDPASPTGRNRDVWQYLDGVAADSPIMKDEGGARRLLRNLIEVFGKTEIDHPRHRAEELIHHLRNQYPGENDLPHVRHLKRLIREWETECLSAYLGFDGGATEYLRFVSPRGETPDRKSELDRRVTRILHLLGKTKPILIMVSLAPEANGPDPDHEILEAVATAVKRYEKEVGRLKIEILGYRNVWSWFYPSEANLYVPVSLDMFSLLQSLFLNAFPSQKEASFPSFEHDGPLSELAQQIQVGQFQMLETCLGRHFFTDHPSPTIRAARGFLFLRRMTLTEFCSHVDELGKAEMPPDEPAIKV